jgi:hypothetical protein
MTECLENNGNFGEAKEMYDVLFDAHGVFEVLDLQEA